MKIVINGVSEEIDKDTSVAQLLIAKNLDTKKIAVERNIEIVSKSLYDSTFLQENDKIEIIHFIGGG